MDDNEIFEKYCNEVLNDVDRDLLKHEKWGQAYSNGLKKTLNYQIFASRTLLKYIFFDTFMNEIVIPIYNKIRGVKWN